MIHHAQPPRFLAHVDPLGRVEKAVNGDDPENDDDHEQHKAQ